MPAGGVQRCCSGMAGRVWDFGELLRRQVGCRGGEGDGLDSVFQALEREVGEDFVGRYDAAWDDAGLLQRDQTARAGGGGGVHA